jgi:hypothetical protein
LLFFFFRFSFFDDGALRFVPAFVPAPRVDLARPFSSACRRAAYAASVSSTLCPGFRFLGEGEAVDESEGEVRLPFALVAPLVFALGTAAFSAASLAVKMSKRCRIRAVIASFGVTEMVSVHSQSAAKSSSGDDWNSLYEE